MGVKFSEPCPASENGMSPQKSVIVSTVKARITSAGPTRLGLVADCRRIWL